MEISSKYSPQEVEQKWYSYWMDNGFFRSTPDEREPYTIVIPPPNVTGVLHMGHMLNNTIQDILIRRARMQGKNACWVPGTDHASIATEAKVVAKLKTQGIDKSALTREEFMQHAWEWKEQYGGVILEQLKKLGASCDWERTCFTMDEERSNSVIKTFIDLHDKGLIYRGVRMVNWDPAAKTALSDEEVIYKEESSKLYYLRYAIVGEKDQWVTIATTRPETILGDTAVCVNPNDERFAHLIGKQVIVPIVNRKVPIIGDEYVDMEFGTGCLKITPAHDINDYEIGLKHQLPVIDIFNDDGTLSEAAEFFVGEDRFAVKKAIIPKLEELGHLVKIEDYTNKVGYSERTQVVIEPKLSAQWFLKMKEMAAPALEHVMNDDIAFHPPKFKNVYRHWMENIKDWCISRQLWWGHQIPVYYLEDGSYVVAHSMDEAVDKARKQTQDSSLTADKLTQDEDVLDTWASSWLWPIAVFDGVCNPDNNEINYYYPSNDLVTGHDIIFFWVARMIMSGYLLREEKPFKNVYFTGMVRDNQGRKMSKQLGNSPDPLDLIAKYGADGVRVGMLFCSPAGGDLLFDESLPEQGRNFSNKIWNVFRLISSWEVDNNIPQPEAAKETIAWFESRLNQAMAEIEDHYSKFRLSDALMTLYTLFRDDFSSWFLEAVKPAYQSPIDAVTLKQTIDFLEKQLKIMHPFMPFITEHIWQAIADRKNDSLMLSRMPEIGKIDPKILEHFEEAKEIISGVRNIRKQRQLAQKDSLDLLVVGKQDHFTATISKMANLKNLESCEDIPDNTASFLVKTTRYAVPLGDLINVEEEVKKLEEELAYNKGFLQTVMKKLNNERFVSNAPAQVVEIENKKKEDAEAKIASITEQIAKLKK